MKKLLLALLLLTALTLTLALLAQAKPAPRERLYSDSSPFNQLIPVEATYTPETRIGTFRQVYEDWSAPIYRVELGQKEPLVRIINNYSGRTEYWHIPTTALPAPEADHHMAIIHAGTGMIYEMWDARWVGGQDIQAGGMNAFPIDGTGVSDPPNYRVTAAGFAVTAGMVMREDFTDPATGKLDKTRPIQHALTMALPETIISDAFIAPAVGGEEMGVGGSEGIPMGALFALPRDLDLEGLEIHPMTLKLLQAARDYGVYVNDRNAAPDYNSQAVGTIRFEPGLTQDLFGEDSDDLMDTIQSEIYTVIAEAGFYRVQINTPATTP